MANSIKIRAKAKGGVATVKSLLSHTMETGTRRNSETGELIPPHFIEEVTCEHNGKLVMSAHWGPAVSKNPYLSFMFKGAKTGDSVTISWRDNKGDTASQEAILK